MRALAAANDHYLVSLLKDTLRDHYVADFVTNAEDTSYLSQVNTYDAIIVDDRLDDMSGAELCVRLRDERVSSPILILLAQGCDSGRAFFLDNGADMCLQKPFEAPELLAKLRAIIRRSYIEICGNKVFVGDLTVNIHSKTLERGSTRIGLRRKEFELIEYLVKNKGSVVPKEVLLEHIWEVGMDVSSNTLEVHINRLREKVDRGYEKKLIKTVHGFGYMIQE